MKIRVLGFFLMILLSSALFQGCAGSSEKPVQAPAEAVKEQYQCPMCKDQLFDKPGKCPACEMELIKVTKS